MDQPRADFARRQRHLLGAEGLHRVEALAAALGEDADQIDDDFRAFRRAQHRGRIAQVRLHRG